MFDPANVNIIATTEVDEFADVRLFTGLQLIGTDTTSTTEQVVLATNKGLFRSATRACANRIDQDDLTGNG